MTTTPITTRSAADAAILRGDLAEGFAFHALADTCEQVGATLAVGAEESPAMAIVEILWDVQLECDGADIARIQGLIEWLDRTLGIFPG